ncbi:unnamed protein product, partial [Ectocarpus sp. 12 AP-2014]
MHTDVGVVSFSPSFSAALSWLSSMLQFFFCVVMCCRKSRVIVAVGSCRCGRHFVVVVVVVHGIAIARGGRTTRVGRYQGRATKDRQGPNNNEKRLNVPVYICLSCRLTYQ